MSESKGNSLFACESHEYSIFPQMIPNNGRVFGVMRVKGKSGLRDVANGAAAAGM